MYFIATNYTISYACPTQLEEDFEFDKKNVYNTFETKVKKNILLHIKHML